MNVVAHEEKFPAPTCSVSTATFGLVFSHRDIENVEYCLYPHSDGHLPLLKFDHNRLMVILEILVCELGIVPLIAAVVVNFWGSH